MTEFSRGFEIGRLQAGLPKEASRRQRLGHLLGALSYPRLPSKDESLRESRQHNFTRALELAQGPNKIAMQIIKEASKLPLATGRRAGEIIPGSTLPGVLLERRLDNWSMWLAVDDSEVSMNALARMVPTLGSLAIKIDHPMAVPEEFMVSALSITSTADSTLNGHIQRPRTVLQCYDGPMSPYRNSDARVISHVDINFNELGTIDDVKLFEGGGGRRVFVDEQRLSTMLVEVESGIHDYVDLHASIENITAGNGDTNF